MLPPGTPMPVAMLDPALKSCEGLCAGMRSGCCLENPVPKLSRALPVSAPAN